MHGIEYDETNAQANEVVHIPVSILRLAVHGVRYSRHLSCRNT